MNHTINVCEQKLNSEYSYDKYPILGVKHDPTIKLVHLPHEVEPYKELPLTDIVDLKLFYNIFS